MNVLAEGILIMAIFMVIMGFILGMKDNADKK
jgi:hypothetical protein